MKRSLLLLPSALLATLALVACNARDNTTAGQKVDSAIAGAKAGATQAANTVSAAATDATITTKINAALAADDKLKALKIDVDTSNGRVVLAGTAPDADSKARATTMAKAVEGVVDVDNRLTVESKG